MWLHKVIRIDWNQIFAKIQEVVAYALENRAAFSAQVQKMTSKESEGAIKAKMSELRKVESRLVELDNIIKRSYEDNIRGKLSDSLFEKFQNDYKNEYAALETKQILLNSEIEELQSKIANVQGFMALAESFGKITELTADVARRFIDRITVHEHSIEFDYNDKTARGTWRQIRKQEVQVFINCIGEFRPE